MAKLSSLSSGNNDKKNQKKKKKKSSGPKALAMKVSAPKPNPFESIWSRRKFDVLGKKRKGEERRIGLARSHAIEKVASLDNCCKLTRVYFLPSVSLLRFFLCVFFAGAEEEDAIEGVRAEWQGYKIYR